MKPNLLSRTRAEWRRLSALALPIFIGQLANTCIGFVDTMMAGRVSPGDLAAVAIGNSFWLPFFLLMSGILLATTAKVARHFGAGHVSAIGPLLRQSIWLGFCVGCLLAVLMWNAEPVLHWLGISPDLIEPSMGYLRAVTFGFPAGGVFLALRCYSEALGRTRPGMAVGIIGLLINIPVNYVFIYGKLGVPAMGGVGCGWATSTVMVAMMLCMLVWISWADHYKQYRSFAVFEWPVWQQQKSLLALGVPIGIAIFAEVSIFSIIALLIGGLGANTVAGHQIALNFSSLVFMLPYSLGMATTVRVGQEIGAGRPLRAYFAARVAMVTALMIACISFTIMLVLRDPIARIYTADPEVLRIAAALIVYAAIFQFSDAVQITAAAALRGYQDMRITMLITLFVYWGIGLPIGYTLGLTDLLGPARGPAGMWIGLITALTCGALLLGLRLRHTAHRNMGM